MNFLDATISINDGTELVQTVSVAQFINAGSTLIDSMNSENYRIYTSETQERELLLDAQANELSTGDSSLRHNYMANVIINTANHDERRQRSIANNNAQNMQIFQNLTPNSGTPLSELSDHDLLPNIIATALPGAENDPESRTLFSLRQQVVTYEVSREYNETTQELGSDVTIEIVENTNETVDQTNDFLFSTFDPDFEYPNLTDLIPQDSAEEEKKEEEKTEKEEEKTEKEEEKTEKEEEKTEKEEDGKKRKKNGHSGPTEGKKRGPKKHKTPNKKERTIFFSQLLFFF
jgi:hypothetical protein